MSEPRGRDSIPEFFSVTVQQIDLTTLPSDQLPKSSFDVITSFATLHHIPSRELRLNILNTIHGLLNPDGLFIHSNWQFLNSDKLKSRIQDWSKTGLSPSDVDPNDYLLDWRSGGED